MRLSWLAVGITALVALVGCVPPEEGGAGQSTAPVTGTVSPSSGGGSPPIVERERPASWLTRLFGSIPNIRCGEPVQPGQDAGTDVVHRFGAAVICVPATFSARLELTSPTGRKIFVPSAPGQQWLISSTLGGPEISELGAYPWKIIPADGPDDEVIAHGVLDARPATEPTFRVSSDGAFRPGFVLRIELSGFEPGTQALVSVYGPGASVDEHEVPLFADLDAKRLDGNGEGVLTWQAPDDLPLGGYALWVDPCAPSCRAEGNSGFTVRE